MVLFIHAAQREHASLMLVGTSKEFNKNKESKKSKELLQFLTLDVPRSKLKVLLRGDAIVFVHRLVFLKSKPPDVLRGIDTILKKFDLIPKDLKGICVLSGPGQFSFLRTSVVTANTFGWALGIPVVGVQGSDVMTEREFIIQGLKKLSRTKRFHPVMPEYGKEPNITIAKKLL